MFFFFFNDTATTEIYTLSLHDALPIFAQLRARVGALKFNVLLSPDQADRSSILTRIVDARDAKDLAALSLQQHLDLSVTTDDRPFFFNQLNALDPASIQLALSSFQGVVRGNLLATVTL